MPYLNPLILDDGLSVLTTTADRIDLCSAEPADFATATGSASLGNRGNYFVSAPADRAAGGREVTAAAVTDGAVTAAGEAVATHWAIVDTTAGQLLAAGPLAAPQTVTGGNTWTAPAFAIGIPNPA